MIWQGLLTPALLCTYVDLWSAVQCTSRAIYTSSALLAGADVRAVRPACWRRKALLAAALGAAHWIQRVCSCSTSGRLFETGRVSMERLGAWPMLVNLLRGAVLGLRALRWLCACSWSA